MKDNSIVLFDEVFSEIDVEEATEIEAGKWSSSTCALYALSCAAGTCGWGANISICVAFAKNC